MLFHRIVKSQNMFDMMSERKINRIFQLDVKKILILNYYE